MSNTELDYLIGLKKTTLIRLNDMLKCNSSSKTIKDEKETYDLICYNIDKIKKKYGLLHYNENVGINIPMEQEDPYSSFAAYTYTGTKSNNNAQEVQTQIQEYDYLLPRMKNNTEISNFAKYQNLMKKKPVEHAKEIIQVQADDPVLYNAGYDDDYN